MRDPIVREFVFFDNADKPLFVRTDAEQATWQVDEYSLTCNFPFVADKRIERGMRVSFDDEDGVHQFFEVRKVKTYTPDGYQELTCEHIVISELTDVHTAEQPLTNVTPAVAVQTALDAQTQTDVLLWRVGNYPENLPTSSGDIGLGSVWQNIRSIEQNWNVYILPRVTYNTTGITGRYLDIIPADSANRWRGMRLSIDKNMDEAGVTVDDTDVKTALYGYGGTVYTKNTTTLDKNEKKINLIGATWDNPPQHARLDATAGYIEDTDALSKYGRNGQNRFGFYQNSDIVDITNAEGQIIQSGVDILKVKTWEALQATNKPRVTIDCMLRDLYRMGYDDEPVRLHDLVQVELLPVHDNLRLEIIKLSVDLLDPTATRPTIGVYIPNIVYIQRQTAYNAAGGVSSTLSGRRGGGRSGGQTKAEAEWSEFQAGIEANNMIISLHAEQVTRSNEIIRQAGMSLDAKGVIIYATDKPNMLQSKIDVQADRIGLVVEGEGKNKSIRAAKITAAINAVTGDTNAIIQADHVYIDAAKTFKLSDVFTADTGKIIFSKLAQFGASSPVTINNGSVNAPTLQVNTSGSLKFASGEGEESTYLELTATKAASLIADVKIVSDGTNGYKLQYRKVGSGSSAYGNWTDAGTFSRATILTGAVDGSKHTLTVTATPQNEKIAYIVTQTGSWSGNTYNGTINITEQGKATEAIRTFTLSGPGGVSSVTYLNGNGVPVSISNYGTIAVPFSGDNYGTTININNGEFAFNINGSHPTTHNISFGATSTSVPSGYGSSPAKTVTAGTGSNHFYFTVTCGTSKKYVQINY